MCPQACRHLPEALVLAGPPYPAFSPPQGVLWCSPSKLFAGAGVAEEALSTLAQTSDQSRGSSARVPTFDPRMHSRGHRCACIWGHVSQLPGSRYKPVSLTGHCVLYPQLPRFRLVHLPPMGHLHLPGVCVLRGLLGPCVILVCRPAHAWPSVSVFHRVGRVWAEPLLNQISLLRFQFFSSSASPSSSPPTLHLHSVLTFRS